MEESTPSKRRDSLSATQRLKSFLSNDASSDNLDQAETDLKPIAELFSDATVIFADIAGELRAAVYFLA
jgi:hypothetical protein